MFIVIVTHDTTHGQISTPVYVNNSDNLFALSSAIRCATMVTNTPAKRKTFRCAGRSMPFPTNYGYEFLDDKAMVCVYSISENKGLHHKHEAMDSLIFVRRYVKIAGQEPRWEEEWTSEELKQKYEVYRKELDK